MDLTPYYDAAEINPEVTSSADGWLTKQQLYHFLFLVAEGENIPELGFVVGETMTPETLDFFKTDLAAATTLHETLHVFCRLINRHVENNHSWLEDDTAGDVWFLNQTNNPFPADRRVADHAGLMTMINVVRLVTGSDWYPKKVKLQTGETDAVKKVAGFQNTMVEFGATATGFTFPSLWLYRPLHERAEVFSEYPVNEALLKTRENLSDKLCRLLSPLVGTGGMAPSLELLAHICGLNSRTLQRRLREEGHTFAELLETIRMEKAVHLLSTDLSIKEIAWELGYSGPNNFIRAFKRRMGPTPHAFRLKNRPA